MLGHRPRQQFGDLIDGMLGDTLNDETQIGFRVETVEFRRTDQTVDGRRAFAPGIGAGEQEVLPSQRDRA